MATYLDLITRSMRLAGILGEGDTPTGDQAADALATLNDLISGINTQSLALFQTVNDQVTLTPGQDTYTIGQGGDFSVDRPVQINAAYVDYQGVSFPLYEATQEEFNKITLKSLTQPLPKFFLYLNTYPLGTIRLWPVPSQALTMYMTVDRLLPPVGLNDTITFPPGYEKTGRLALACELCVEYGKPVPPNLEKMAREAFADLKRSNWTSSPAGFDPDLTGQPGGIAGFLSGY